MTHEEAELLEIANSHVALISEFQALEPPLGLPFEAARQLRHVSEAIAGCELVLYGFAGRITPSKEALLHLGTLLRSIHQRLDEIVLPAEIDEAR
jgi:hypothetical protein